MPKSKLLTIYLHHVNSADLGSFSQMPIFNIHLCWNGLKGKSCTRPCYKNLENDF